MTDRVGDSVERQRVSDAFRRRFGADPEVLVRAPGRVALLGAHVDYNDGWVMPAAIDRCIWLAASVAEGTAGGGIAGQGTVGEGSVVHAVDIGSESAMTFDVRDLPPPVAERGDSARWADLPIGVAWALSQSGRQYDQQLKNLRAVYGGNVPIGAGVSSSAAVACAFLLAWDQLGGFGLSRLDCALLGRQCENDYLGVASGIMDQFACLHGEADHVVLLDCRTLEHRLLPLPADVVVLVADSGVRRRLSDSGFNDRPAECRRVVELLRPVLPSLRALRDLSAADLERHGDRLSPALHRRAQHVVEECQRVQRATAALTDEPIDIVTFGQLMRRSHESSRDLYEVTVPEVDELCRAAWRAEGCHGARMMGGGFGGCVAMLVDQAAESAVRAAVSEHFLARFGHRPPMFSSRPADGAEIMVPAPR